MSKIIDFELPAKYFHKDRNNRLEARLAKFDLANGDILRFHEIDENGDRTGQYFDRQVKDFHKIHKATKYWSKDDLTKFGIYIFELEEPKELNESIFYPLYDDFDKDFFEKLKIAIKNKYSFKGDSEEKEYFIKTLLCLQMLKDYRAPLEAIAQNIQEEIDLKTINDQIRSKDYAIDSSWAVWKRDKIMGELAKKLYDSEIKIVGTDEGFDEFVLRYLVSIWLVDWEGPLYAILQLTKSGKINLRELNGLLKLWDFTRLFDE